MKGFRARKLDPIYLLPTEELPVAINYLKNLLPYLTEGLCIKCNKLLLNRVDLLDQELSYQDQQPLQVADVHCHEPKPSSANVDIDKHVHVPDECCDKEEDCDTHSIGSWNNDEKRDCDSDTQSIGSWKDGENGKLEPIGSWNNGEKRDSIGSWKDGENGKLELIGSWNNGEKRDSIGSWKDGENGNLEPVVHTSEPEVATPSEASNVRMSWADMAQEEEDELQEYANNQQQESDPGSDEKKKPELSREKREYLRFMNVQRKKDFVCLERVRGKMVNVVEGLELHAGVFSTAEQKRIVDFVFELQEKGSRGELKERTYTAPQKWMRGKGRVTIQFGCCYNYAPDRKGNPPGILRNELVDPIPNLLKVMIRRLVQWHVLPASCVPDSCIVNIYDEGDCIPPHIDNHDFVRPFCTVSFLSECDIVFGSTLKIVGPGEFSGSAAIPLPVGSVLVLKGNGADVAKHCVPAVPSKRISITFRKMDEQKRPLGFVPEPDLQGIEPLPYKSDESHVLNLQVKTPLSEKRGGILGRAPTDNGGSHSEPRQTVRGTHSDSGGSQSEPRQTTERTYSDNDSRHSEPRQTTRGAYLDNGGSHLEPRQTIRGAHSDSGGSQSEPRQTTQRTYSDNDSRHSEPRQTIRGTHSGSGGSHSEPRQTTQRTYSDNGNRRSEPLQTNRGVHSRLQFTAKGTSQSEAQQTAKGTSHSEPQQTSQETHSELWPSLTGTPQSEPRQTARRIPWSQETYRPRARRSVDR